MVIRSIEIGSYKSFLTPVLIPFSPHLNIFIGPNNCGKTNVLDAIDFLMRPEKNPSRLHHHRSQMTLQIDLNQAEQQKYSVGKEVRLEGRRYEVFSFTDDRKQISPELHAALASRVKVLMYEDFSDYEAIERDYTTLEQKYPETFAQLTRLLQDHFPEVQSVSGIVDIDSDTFGSVSMGTKSITLDRLGGGFRRVLVILLYALHPDYSVVLIDEPEIHLHPGMIKKLLRIVEDGVTNQLIVTSHSPLFIAAATLHQIYRVLKDDQGSHVYSLAQNPSHLDLRRLVQELNADNLEMFFADKVLVVEGVSDRILMRGLIDRFYHGPDDIKVIYTHGKSNIDIYMTLMDVFRIPYIVMLDRDALPTFADQFHFQHKRGQYGGLTDFLRNRNIVILDNGSIEQNYPRKYQNKDSKPLNALYAALHITEEEYYSPVMRNVREVIQQL